MPLDATLLPPERFLCGSVRRLYDPVPYGRELLQSLGLCGIQFGSMNRMYRSCLNLDISTATDGMITSAPGQMVQLEGRGYYLQQDATRPLPIADAAFDWAYSEHFLEHLSLEQAAAWLREVRRVVRAGGVVRISTPDLKRYARAYVDGDDAFFAEHARRLAQMGIAGAPVRRAWMMNQIFRFYGHQWIYDADEIRYLAAACGFDAASVRECRFREGADPAVFRFDQTLRDDESLYFELTV